MLRVHESSVASPQNRLILPPRLLLRLLNTQGLPLGSRILVVGCGRGELISFLDEMSFDVEGVDDSAEAVAVSRQIQPRFDIRFVRLSEALPVNDHQFDLVLVQDVATFQGNLLDSGARKATANMLSCLKPRGRLVFIRRSLGRWEELTPHEERCWTRHLACFPGDVQVSHYPDSWLARIPQWLVRRQTPQPGYYTVAIECPLQLITRAEWLDYARRGAMTGRGACCDSVVCVPVQTRAA